VVGFEKCLLVKTCHGIYGSIMTVEGCFCRELLETAGADEPLELSGAEL